MLITDAQLIERIEAFLIRHDMAPTRFGREAANEASFINTLKNGRSVSLARANKVVAFMERYERERLGGVHSVIDTARHQATSSGKSPAYSHEVAA